MTLCVIYGPVIYAVKILTPIMCLGYVELPGMTLCTHEQMPYILTWLKVINLH